MKNSTLRSIMLVFLSKTTILLAQTHLVIPFAERPVMDGVVSGAEWDDAVEVSIQINATKQTKVRAMHHLDTLYLAYLGNLESMNARFPEVVFDPANQKGNTWAADHWWFHVSATDCASQGAPNNYQNCALVQPDWVGVPNLTPGLPITDTVEIAIPLTKVGIGLSDTFGIAFNVTNTFNVWNFWPPTATLPNPSSWTTASFEQGATSAIGILGSANTWSIFPNPGKGPYTLHFEGWEQDVRASLLTIQGNVLHRYRFRTLAGRHNYSLETGLAALPVGIYLLKIEGEAGSVTLRLLVN